MMKTDIEIAQECTMEPITEVAERAGIPEEYLEQYGKYKAKIDYNFLKKSDKKDGKLILVTAINPTPAGEGKTTTTVGLADALQRMGKKPVVALREPSLGPVFGMKGGAAGGGGVPGHHPAGPERELLRQGPGPGGGLCLAAGAGERHPRGLPHPLHDQPPQGRGGAAV